MGKRRRWVVGTDGSDHAYDALHWAALHAREHDAVIELVTAWQYPYTGVLPIGTMADVDPGAAQRDIVLAELAETAERARAVFGVMIETSATNGPSAYVLLQASQHAGLLVVGRRGRGGFKRLLLGSVSHQVAANAKRPTVIVPDGPTGPRLESVVVGVDGSHNSMAALRWAHVFVPDTCEIAAVSAWEVPYLGEGADIETVSSLRNVHDLHVGQAIESLEEELGVIDRFTRKFEVGRSSQVLAELGADADLVVVGARGRSGLSAAVLGSTTTWIAHHPPCPTVIVPDDPPNDDLANGRSRQRL